ncbi:polyprenol phosphomannose-dependent alpha 1,6 mannosyltransferase MptB [Psychromicrobium xiongbiense]|uniref:polyprenol phosphomannose-dependent alpha 1,6 mannosyltransferase MptB n=1 Tax=Psychromicrobium xiongbiense TaxID=3051184 RepID=UPI00255261AB|nr:polyprenol phosphomannose-dependent alpha 1,6 mannosyltransferase MptB [Psychromicrobium sp. YIM S02556]
MARWPAMRLALRPGFGGSASGSAAAAPRHPVRVATSAEPARRFRDAPGQASVAIWQGFAGSVLMMLGGLGVGWMAPRSPLLRLPLFAELRTNPVLAVLCTVALALGGLLLVRAWLRFGQRVGHWELVHRRLLYKVIALWSVPLMFTMPLFSRDVYSYIGQGRLMVAGLDPYTDGISSLSNWFDQGPDQLWAEAPTPYGPLFLWIEQAVVWVSGGSLDIAVFLFRVVAAAGVVLCAFYLAKLADRLGFDPSRTLWLVVANPLFVINFVASVHNDGLMLGFVVAGIYAVLTKRPILAILLVTASVAVKPITLIALPFVALLWAGPSAGWGRRIYCWIVVGGGSMALLALAGWVNGLWFGWVGALSTPGAVWIWYAPFGLLAATVGFAVDLFGGQGTVATTVVQTIGKVLGVLIALWLILRGRPDRILMRMALAFTAVVMTAPMIQPWYVIWLMVFFVLAGVDEDWHVKVFYLLTVFFTVIALTDQLNVSQYSVPVLVVRIAAIVLSVAFSAYIMFWDRKTKVLFNWPLPWRRRGSLQY